VTDILQKPEKNSNLTDVSSFTQAPGNDKMSEAETFLNFYSFVPKRVLNYKRQQEKKVKIYHTNRHLRKKEVIAVPEKNSGFTMSTILVLQKWK